MTRTINISLNVPDSYGIEELTRQLTEYVVAGTGIWVYPSTCPRD